MDLRICPPELREAALTLLLPAELDPAARGDWVRRFLTRDPDDPRWVGLRVALGTDGGVDAVLWLEGLGRRAGMLWPPVRRPEVPAATLEALIDAAVEQSRQAGQRSLVVQLADSAACDAVRLTRCGFKAIADLWDMALDLAYTPRPYPLAPPEGVRWHTFTDDEHAAAAAVLDRAVGDSTDFPELDRPRTGEELLLDFLAKPTSREGSLRLVCVDPVHLPEGLAEQLPHTSDGIAVGILLLGRDLVTRTVEIEYLGLIAEVRGRGWGRWMTGEACRAGCVWGDEGIWVSVDSRNAPAVRSYTGQGFTVRGRRLVMHRRTA